ncbi:MAG: response regulator transcription factor [Clostridia bacterium]|nr:response regulator transcription factor [Clostridia bacterium]
MRLLVAENEKDLNGIIAQKLKACGYSVDCCFDGNETLELLSYAEYDGIIIDIVLPFVDGLKVVESIRSEGRETPVIFIAAGDSIDENMKEIMSEGADYLVKPFSSEQLITKVRSVVNNLSAQSPNVLKAADLEVNTDTRTVTRGGETICLTAKEYMLLEYLIQNKGIVLSREKIENHIWNFSYEGGTNVIDVYVSYLRRKVDPKNALRLIHTIRGKGYVLRD